MRKKTLIELPRIQGELIGIALGIETFKDFNRENAVAALRTLAKKLEDIYEIEKEAL